MINLFPFKKVAVLFTLLVITILLAVSCKKNDIGAGIDNPPATPPDLTTTVTSSVSGFITDENNGPAKDAIVTIGAATITTDKYGYFEARNVMVVKEAAVVTVNKAGYFKSIKTFIATAGKSAFFRVKLIPKTNAGTVNGSSGGAITLSNGLSIAFTANSIINAATNAAYTGTVNVAAFFINPTSADLNSIMPGDLRGLNTAGNLQLLTTYGMAAVELTGSGGELLQIATGKKATLSMPIPAALSAAAPASIPLWYFDEAKGLWKQEGSATKTGSNYVGEVSHFSFWNCDIPGNYVQFNCTVVNNNNQPLKNVLVKITVAGNPGSATYGYTDSAGYVSGAVPANVNLLLEVLSNCNNSIHSQTFITTTANVSLGTIAVTNNTYLATITGTVNTCANSTITNGNILLQIGQQYYSYPVSNGIFNFTTVLCSTPSSVSVIAIDNANMQQSTPTNYILNAGNNAIGNIKTCGLNTEEFIEITGSGIYADTLMPAETKRYSSLGQEKYTFAVTGPNNITSIYASSNIVYPQVFLYFLNTGISLNSQHDVHEMQVLGAFGNLAVAGGTEPGGKVTITEYGAIGEYIAGNFTCVRKDAGNPWFPNDFLKLTGSFRVRRTF
jgi:hypothetical protein